MHFLTWLCCCLAELTQLGRRLEKDQRSQRKQLRSTAQLSQQTPVPMASPVPAPQGTQKPQDVTLSTERDRTSSGRSGKEPPHDAGGLAAPQEHPPGKVNPFPRQDKQTDWSSIPAFPTVSSCGPKAAAPRARLPSPPRLHEPRPKSCPAMLPHCSGQIFPIPAAFLSSTLRIWNSRSSAQKDFVVTLLLLVSKKGGGGEGPEPLMVFWLLCATSPVQELCLTGHSCGWMGREGKWREWRRWMLIPQALGSCWSQQRMVTASPQHQEPGGRGFSSLLANESHFPASGRGWQQH